MSAAAAPAVARDGSALLRSASSLLLGSGAAAVLGLVFWILAARLFDAADVGRCAALLGAMIELSTICQLNLDNILVRFLPRVRDRVWRAVGGAYAVNAALAGVLGTAFVVGVPALSEEFAFLRERPAFAAAFVVALALWGVFTLQDAALTAMRRAPWVAVESTVFGLLKIAALPLALACGMVGEGVFVAWVVPMALLLVPVNVLLARRAVPAHRRALPATRSAFDDVSRRALARFAAQDYAGQLAMRAGVTVLPVLVVAMLGPEAGAWFAVPFTLLVSIEMMVLSVATSVVAEVAYDEARLGEHLRTVTARFAPLLPAGVMALLLLAHPLLLPFGADYAREGADALRLLALAVLPRAAVLLAGAVWRVEGRGGRLLGVELAMVVLLLASLPPLAHVHGLPGVALAWAGSATIAAVPAVATLVRALRRGSAA